MALLHRQSHRYSLASPSRLQITEVASLSRRPWQAIFRLMNSTVQHQAAASLTWRRLLVALVLACLGRTGLATLGAAPATADNGTRSINAAYTITESLLDNGTQVQEFVTPAGRVFAVSWRGPVLPDLRSILGDYIHIFHRHIEASRQTGLRGGPVNLAQQGLVLRSSGRMGHFSGHAYVPALVPVGVNIHELLG